jgi:hypothetical protein
MIGTVFQPEWVFRHGAMLMLLMLAGLAACAQTGTDATPNSLSTISASTLNGNWYIVGNRMKKQFPLLSIYLHVDGTQIIGNGDVQAVCPDNPRNGGGSIGGGFHGEIAPDGSFTLRNSPQSTLHVEMSGQAPAEGATSWRGEYTLTGEFSRGCPGYRQTSSFTAIPLTPLNGTFSGSLTMRYFQSPPPNYAGPKSNAANLSIAIKQGDDTSRRLKGGIQFYLPLTGTVEVKGSSCFSHGFADPLTYSTHGSLPSRFSILRGDASDLWFAMDDESQLHVIAVFAEPGESALSIIDARVIGGNCDHQSFLGTLERR